MYLSIKQHDQFRTLLMGFEIPFRGYIADVLMTHYSSANDLETALLAKNASLTPADPFFLRDVLPNSVKHSKIEKMYNTFSTASLTTEIVAVDQDIPRGHKNQVVYYIDLPVRWIQTDVSEH